MALDPYAPCPCGSGRKLKFCCTDLMSEMDKIQRMLEGEQRAACLEYIKGLLAKQPNRASLLGLKAMLENQLEQFDAARQTVDQFLAQHPDNPMALTELALLQAAVEGGRAASATLQSVMERIGREVPGRTYEAIGAVGQVLLLEGNVLAARSYISLQAEIGGENDQRPTLLLLRLLGSPRVPLLLKEDWPLSPAPQGTSWEASFNAALHSAIEGRWRQAATQFAALLDASQDAPVVWRNLGLTRAWYADLEGAVEAFHKYATLDVPFDDAVEMEALAQLLDPTKSADMVDLVQTVYPIHDFEALLSAINSDSRATRVPVETYAAREDAASGPPPRAAFAVLSRPQLTSGVEDFALDQIPAIVGYAYLFGRETDREARVELRAQSAEHAQIARTVLAEIGGGALGESSSEEALGQVSRLSHLMSWNWRLPDDTPREKRQALIQRRRHDILLDQWPHLPQAQFGGKTLVEAAQDPALKIPVLAAILNLELTLQVPPDEVDFNEVRAKLQLPAAAPIDPTTLPDQQNIPLSRLGRLEVEKLATINLVAQYQRAHVLQLANAAWELGQELLRRTDLPDDFDRLEVLGKLAQLAPELEQAKQYIDEARRIAESQGESSAPWDLAELSLQLEWGAADAAGKLFNHIRSAHGREPGVAQALTELLMEAGLIAPNGAFVGAPQGEAQSGIVLPGSPVQEPGQIWTPDGGGAGGEKKLWIPD